MFHNSYYVSDFGIMQRIHRNIFRIYLAITNHLSSHNTFNSIRREKIKTEMRQFWFKCEQKTNYMKLRTRFLCIVSLHEAHRCLFTDSNVESFILLSSSIIYVAKYAALKKTVLDGFCGPVHLLRHSSYWSPWLAWYQDFARLRMLFSGAEGVYHCRLYQNIRENACDLLKGDA